MADLQPLSIPTIAIDHEVSKINANHFERQRDPSTTRATQSSILNPESDNGSNQALSTAVDVSKTHTSLELDISGSSSTQSPGLSAPGSPSSRASDLSDETVIGSASDLEDSHGQKAPSPEDVEKRVWSELDTLIGLEHVKDQFRDIKRKVGTYQKQSVNLRKERFHVKFLGNPGTGKTTVARLYAMFLYSMGVLKSERFKETSGALLISEGTIEAAKVLTNGVVFIDEAYQLTAPHQPSGRQILDVVHTMTENNMGRLVIIFAGYNKDMETFIQHNSGLDSRIPYTLHFEDFTSDELHEILRRKIGAKYNGRMQIERHPEDTGQERRYLRIASDRLSRGRGSRGFGNARSVETLLERIAGRQARRLDGMPENQRAYLNFTREDLIGPSPGEDSFHSQAWVELQMLIGLKDFKKRVKLLIGTAETNYQREVRGLKPEAFPLNGIFLGKPGTGKTTVAKHYGQILADLGLLSIGEVIVKNPSDFIGGSLGASEANTRAILSSTIGKVLIIDEAYGLFSGSSASGGGNPQDNYRAGVIDTLVAEIHGEAGEDRCILLLGYEDQMKTMFQKVNPGLKRRFASDDPFHFPDFSLDELTAILELKMEKEQLSATKEAITVAREVLQRASRHPEFANAGAVQNCLSEAKRRHQARLQSTEADARDYYGQLTPADFDPDYGLKASGYTDCHQLLKGIVSEGVQSQLEEYQRHALMARWSGQGHFNDGVPTNFIFKGGPGTGKTAAARHMGIVYYNLGFLGSKDVIECSVVDFIGEYVGQTRPKTQAQLDKGLGKVLLIDDAHQLLGGPYAAEALEEITSCLEKPRYARKLVVILAGYFEEMNNLLRKSGVSSLFPNEVNFENLEEKDCLALLDRELAQIDISAPFLKDDRSEDYRKLAKLVRTLSLGPFWGNAKDIKSMAKLMKAVVFKGFFEANRAQVLSNDGFPPPPLPALSGQQAIGCVRRLIEDRKKRSMPPTNPQRTSIPRLHNDELRLAQAEAFFAAPMLHMRIDIAINPAPSQTSLGKGSNQQGNSLGWGSLSSESTGASVSLTATISTMAMTVSDHPSHSFAPQRDQRVFEMEDEEEELDEKRADIDEPKEKSPPLLSSDDKSSTTTALSTPPDASAEAANEDAETRTSATADESTESTQTQPAAQERPAMQEDAAARRTRLKQKYAFREVPSESTKRALRNMGVCPQGFEWRWIDGIRHRCAGGCHFVYDPELRDYMDANGY